MGPAVDMDAWLQGGSLVVAASDRAARAQIAGFHTRRRAQAAGAWPAPSIYDWKTFARRAWEQHAVDARLTLNPLQEQSLWSNIVAASGHSATLLEPSRRRLAAMAMEAHQLLCSYAPHLLDKRARTAWQQDAAAFSRWLSEFSDACATHEVVSDSRIPLELVPLLQASTDARPPLLLTGFDRLLPAQRRLFDAWGKWQQQPAPLPARDVHFYSAADPHAELTACASWCQQQIAANSQSRLLVVTQDAIQNRGAIERAFMGEARSPAAAFEFSLGVPLGQVAIASSARMLLTWLESSLQEHEIDWLLATGHGAADAGESAALAAHMRSLRRRGLERMQWTLAAFCHPASATSSPPDAWIQRMKKAQQLRNAATRTASPLNWAALVPQLLDAMGWPGERPLTSAEFQAAQRWQQVVETCGSLGFDGRRISWKEYLSELTVELETTLFATESFDAPVLIAGPAESAGLIADGVWFLGADEDTWPAPGSMNPLLPLDVQRENSMPHATPQLDWDLAHAITTRLLSSAAQVCFSHARQSEGVDVRASRLVTQLAGSPQPMPASLTPAQYPEPLSVPFLDHSRIGWDRPDLVSPDARQMSLFNPTTVQRPIRGGAAVLTAQAQCPFKAFATARLDAKNWNLAEAGLTPAMRGQLLHSVLHSVWSGPPRGIRTLDELRGMFDRGAFVAAHVQQVIREEFPAAVREQMPARYIDLEANRLARVVSEWLAYEAGRLPFTVTGTELEATTTVAGLPLKLRLDRIDRLNDGTMLILDYKTGAVSPRAWDLPRPDDVQLPLYAGFALDTDEEVGGLVFAKVRPGEHCFAGRVGAAASTLRDDLKGTSTLVKNPLTAEQLIAWREAIEQLARDFLAGRADVDPREYPKTCERCDLQSLCRIQERGIPDACEDVEALNE